MSTPAPLGLTDSPPAAVKTAPAPLDSLTRRRMAYIIGAQCLGMLTVLAFTNGFMQMFLQKKLGLPAVDALFYVSLPYLMQALMLMPAAYFSDRYGSKLIGYIGNGLMIAGVASLAAAGALALTAPGPLAHALAFFGCAGVGGGYALYTSNWYALLQPIIPEHVRGRFFGFLRVSWQVVCVLLFVVVSWFLDRSDNAPSTFLTVLAMMTVFLIVRVAVYARIPELETERAPAGQLLATLLDIMRRPNYMPFCSYLFLLNLFTGAAPWIFPLLEGDVLGYAPDRVVLMGTVMFVGQIVGFLVGGLLVDRFGTRVVFVCCHLGFGAILGGMVARGLSPLPLPIWIGLMRCLFGVAFGASSIAITSELLGLLPEKNKSLATALALTLMALGISLAGWLAARVVALHILAPTWQWGEQSLSQYDTLLLGCGVMVTLLTITLSLVPSVIRKARWIAQ